MVFKESGTLTTDKRTVDDAQTWDTDSDWNAYQSKTNITITNGTLELSEVPLPPTAIDQFVASSFDDGADQWPGELGNYTLTGGSPTFVQDVLNGYPAVRFDGVDDYLSVTFSGAESQPNTIFIVGILNSAGSNNQPLFDGISNRQLVYWVDSNGLRWAIYAGNSNVDGSQDSTSKLFTAIFDGGSSIIREDGTQTGSGSAGTNSLDGITLGAFADQTIFGNVDILEVVPCNSGLSQSEIDQEESRLATKYGITI